MKGLFVAFEGVDRSGKTTQLQLLAQRLSEKHEVLLTREPGGTPVAEALVAAGTVTPTPPLPEITGVDDSLQTIGSLGGALTIAVVVVWWFAFKGLREIDRFEDLKP